MLEDGLDDHGVEDAVGKWQPMPIADHVYSTPDVDVRFDEIDVWRCGEFVHPIADLPATDNEHADFLVRSVLITREPEEAPVPPGATWVEGRRRKQSDHAVTELSRPRRLPAPRNLGDLEHRGALVDEDRYITDYWIRMRCIGCAQATFRRHLKRLSSRGTAKDREKA
jgi:hypothetical protein